MKPVVASTDTEMGLAVPSAPVNAKPGLYQNYLKRMMDICLVLISAPVSVPTILIFALLVRRDGGPAFYSHLRVGRNGKLFRCVKLRTMVDDADAQLETFLAHNPAQAQEWEKTQKLQHDPRITPFGRFLRKSSIDELPQLWCVLKGDMSLVGPRPFLPSQQELYKGRSYYGLRPGLTGIWQVTERNSTSFSARAKFDGLYAREVSLWTDVKLMFSTVGVVLRGTGV